MYDQQNPLKHYQFLEKVLMRTPRYSLDRMYSKLISGEIIDEDLLECLFFASPNLLNKYNEYKAHWDTEKKIEILNPLYKYFFRSHTRCTPFGLFASVNLCSWGKDTSPFTQNFQPKIKLDSEIGFLIIEVLLNNSDIRDIISYFPNPTLYLVGDRIRYVEPSPIENGKFEHRISAIDNSEYIHKIISQKGKRSLLDISYELVEDEITFDEAYKFVNELISSRILLPEFYPSVSGGDLLTQIITVLEKYKLNANSKVPKLEELIELSSLLQEMEKKKLFNFEHSTKIQNCLHEITNKSTFNNLYHLDLYNEIEFTLDGKYRRSLRNGIKALNYLRRPIQINTNLQSFIERFVSKFGTKPICILEALDPEIGIKYSEKSKIQSDEVCDIFKTIYNNQPSMKLLNFTWNKADKLLYKKLRNARDKDSTYIELSDEDLLMLDPQPCHWPISFSVLFQAIGSGQIQLNGISGYSAIDFLGRYSVSSSEIANFCQEISNMEEGLLSENFIIVEFANIPQPRYANVILHSACRKFEMPYLAQGNTEDAESIALSDIYIQYSVYDNQIILFSKSLCKQILPSTSHVHNHKSPGSESALYNFIKDYRSSQVNSNLNFTWGAISSFENYFPRVIYKDVILSPAIWNFDEEEYKNYLNAFKENEFDKWINSWKLPQCVQVVQGDNTLFIDFNEKYSVQLFHELFNKHKSITLKEFQFEPGTGIVYGPNKEIFTNEFIASMICELNPYNQTDIQNDLDCARKFSPGSPWVYFKIYSGELLTDKLLIHGLAEFNLKNRELYEKYFFIRYSDPEHHLRIRYYIPDLTKRQMLMQKMYSLLKEYIDDFRISKYEIATYDREVERYGLETMENCENIFCEDSAGIINILQTESTRDQNENIRWKYSYRFVFELMSAFGLTKSEMQNFASDMRSRYLLEFKVKKGMKEVVSIAKRNQSELISKIVDPTLNDEICGLAKETIEKITWDIQKIYERSDYLKLINILSSIIHMHINRMFKSDQRFCELVLYILLFDNLDKKQS